MGTRKTILTAPHPSLVRVCKPLKFITRDVRRTTQAMLQLMHEAGGVGLAAPQVGKPWRLFVLDVGEGDTVYLNPVVTHVSGHVVSEEGCLSLPGVLVSLTRSETVRIRGFDLEGAPVDQVVWGMHAIVAQHEADHLDGRLILPGA
jgi:peptide deformylase